MRYRIFKIGWLQVAASGWKMEAAAMNRLFDRFFTPLLSDFEFFSFTWIVHKCLLELLQLVLLFLDTYFERYGPNTKYCQHDSVMQSSSFSCLKSMNSFEYQFVKIWILEYFSQELHVLILQFKCFNQSTNLHKNSFLIIKRR